MNLDGLKLKTQSLRLKPGNLQFTIDIFTF